MSKIKNILFLLPHTKYRLTTLGRSLLYLYVALIVAAFCATLYAAITFLCNLALHQTSISSCIENIILFVASWAIMRLFINESYDLLQKDKPRQEKEIKEEFQSSNNPIHYEPANSNVIEFKRKPANNHF